MLCALKKLSRLCCVVFSRNRTEISPMSGEVVIEGVEITPGLLFPMLSPV